MLYNVSEHSIAIYIPNSAHHLDLRAPNDADPASVTEARQIEATWVGNFIQEYMDAQSLSKRDRKIKKSGFESFL